MKQTKEMGWIWHPISAILDGKLLQQVLPAEVLPSIDPLTHIRHCMIITSPRYTAAIELE